MPEPTTKKPPPYPKVPRHVAIIMDGNGRWAKQRFLPRIAGHRTGVETVRGVVTGCLKHGVEVLTLFAFSSENWRRPMEEVGLLMELFTLTLTAEVKKLDKNNICLRVIGDRTAFNAKLQQQIATAEAQTAGNTALTLVIAANYGGRWDITQATRALARQVQAGELQPDQITSEHISERVCLHRYPEPDLFIRTGGEQRISNFLLWQLSYTEFYFTPLLWPEFDEESFNEAITSFASRQRRFGHTGEQINDNDGVMNA